MPQLQLRTLALEVETTAGPWSFEYTFRPGMNVIHAENTSGKSMFMNAVPFALGLEGSFTPMYQPPFAQAMTTQIGDGPNAPKVIESKVVLELSNGLETITCQRYAKGGLPNTVIRVWKQERAKVTSTGKATDYLVRVPGAAQNEAGFHQYLADFLGWKLPHVETFDGKMVPLYMEYLLPFFFVEQKRGWSGLLAQYPTQFKVKEGVSRAFEFLASLETFSTHRRRAELLRRRQQLQVQWHDARTSLTALISAAGGITKGLPTEVPFGAWTPDTVALQWHFGTEWVGLEDVRERLTKELAVAVSVRAVKDLAPELEIKLSQLRSSLDVIEHEQRRTAQDLAASEEEEATVRQRLIDLQNDLRRNKDLVRLADRGATGEALSRKDCPVCHHDLPVSLAAATQADHAHMTLEQSIAHIDSQVSLFSHLMKAAVSNQSTAKTKLQTLGAQATQVRLAIRQIKDDLVSADTAPALAELQRRAQAHEQLRALSNVSDKADDFLETLGQVIKNYQQNESAIAAVPSDNLTDADKAKISWLTSNLQAQLHEYGYSSLDEGQIVVSGTNYRPERGGVTLMVESSASDMIRLIWAYLIGFAEMSVNGNTNHPKLLMLDEPNQQQVKQENYASFLKHLTKTSDQGVQVVLTTSEPVERVAKTLGGVPVHRITGKLLKPRTP